MRGKLQRVRSADPRAVRLTSRVSYRSQSLRRPAVAAPCEQRTTSVQSGLFECVREQPESRTFRRSRECTGELANGPVVPQSSHAGSAGSEANRCRPSRGSTSISTTSPWSSELRRERFRSSGPMTEQAQPRTSSSASPPQIDGEYCANCSDRRVPESTRIPTSPRERREVHQDAIRPKRYAASRRPSPRESPGCVPRRTSRVQFDHVLVVQNVVAADGLAVVDAGAPHAGRLHRSSRSR